MAKSDNNQKITSKIASKGNTITLMGITMMNVTMIAGIANDVQQSFYGLSSVTFFALGAILFFLPTGLVAAEMASGWGQRGGSFRWIGEGLGKFPAFLSLLILWFQTTILFGSGIPTAAATVGFYTPDLKWAIAFAKHPKHVIYIVFAFLALYWLLAFLAAKGVKVFAKLAKYGVLIGTVIPLALMMVLAVIWIVTGHQSNITIDAAGLVPKWKGLPTLAMAAGVFFSYAGIEMNAAHIKQLKNPEKEYPKSIFLSMIICFLVFVVGTLIIAMVNPEKDINLLYTLAVTFAKLGSVIGMPWLYMLFIWAGFFNLVANLVTNMAGPSYMLGEVARAGFLPKKLQGNNKHGMPAKLMYLQMVFASIITFIFLVVPNIEGFIILLTQAVTVLYMSYYVILFLAYIKLKLDQPNRPRSFKIPGGTFGGILVSVVGISSCVLGIVLAFIPPQQLLAEVGSSAVYDGVITALVSFVVVGAAVLYISSRKKDWVDSTNEFAPFTWEIEGLKKPGKVLSDVPSADMSAGQNPMGTPIVRPYGPNETVADLEAKAKQTGDKDAKDILEPKHTPVPQRSKEAGPPPQSYVKHIALAGPVSPGHAPIAVVPDIHPFYTPDEVKVMEEKEKAQEKK